MPIDFDPVFHTEAMVKILREQGSTQYAMELAELILEKNPQQEGVRRILEELREEARRNFERFKSGGRSGETGAAAAEEMADSSEAVAADPEADLVISSESPTEANPSTLAGEDAGQPEAARLTLVPSPPPPSGREAKILRLQALLRRVQSLRQASTCSRRGANSTEFVE